jgi:hypothetical protein
MNAGAFEPVKYRMAAPKDQGQQAHVYLHALRNRLTLLSLRLIMSISGGYWAIPTAFRGLRRTGFASNQEIQITHGFRFGSDPREDFEARNREYP